MGTWESHWKEGGPSGLPLFADPRRVNKTHGGGVVQITVSGDLHLFS